MCKILLAAVPALTLAPIAATAGTWLMERNAKGVNFATTWDDNHSFVAVCVAAGTYGSQYAPASKSIELEM